jgi:hypothetical protein
MEVYLFQWNILSPYAGSESKPMKQPARIKEGSAYFWTLKMEAVLSSKTSINFYQTSQHHIPEDCTLLYVLGFQTKEQ